MVTPPVKAKSLSTQKGLLDRSREERGPIGVQLCYTLFTIGLNRVIYSEGTPHGNTMLSIGTIGDTYSLGVVTKEMVG